MFHVKHSPGGGRAPALLRAFLVVVMAAGLVAGCVATRDVNPITGNKRLYGYTWEEEIQIGREADPQIVAQFGLYEDEALAEYVRRVGEKVLAHSHLRHQNAEPRFRNLAFTFRVLDSPVVNAFALPGGYVYVTRGLLAHLENEAQLAVVLGHEIGHVAGRHASKRVASQSLLQLGLITGAVVGQGIFGGNTAEQVLNLGSTGLQLLFLSYGRDDERESDDVGVEYAAKAGYKVGEAAAFFRTLERLSAQSNQRLPSFLSTHPDPGEREQTILRYAAEWEARINLTEVGRDAFLARIDGIVLGDNPRQGFVEDGLFYHPDLRFQFPVPPNYQVINEPTRVLLVAPDQQALMLFTIEAQAKTARDAAGRFAAQEGITVVDSGPSTAGGNPAYYVEARARTQDGQNLGLLAYFIEYGGNVYAFTGYTLASLYETYADVFTMTMRGFARLTNPRILNVQPVRLAVETASRAAPFHTFVPEAGRLPRGWDVERMAILNQVERNTPVEPGRKLKLVR
ncbi:MAG: peptidase M48 [Rhodothermaceae bacterium]|nr:MAG: peptidase M48 [Rhodothermaceae bacterium]